MNLKNNNMLHSKGKILEPQASSYKEFRDQTSPEEYKRLQKESDIDVGKLPQAYFKASLVKLPARFDGICLDTLRPSIKKMVLRFVKDPFKGRIFWSKKVGTGKTHAAYICAVLLAFNYQVRVVQIDFTHFLHLVQKFQTGELNEDEKKKLNKLENKPFVFIDDWGTKEISPKKEEYMDFFFNNAYKNNIRPIITMNFDPDNFDKFFQARSCRRIVDRISTLTSKIHFPEKNLRTKYDSRKSATKKKVQHI